MFSTPISNSEKPSFRMNAFFLKLQRNKVFFFFYLKESVRHPGGERSGSELFLPKENLPLTYCNLLSGKNV